MDVLPGQVIVTDAPEVSLSDCHRTWRAGSGSADASWSAPWDIALDDAVTVGDERFKLSTSVNATTTAATTSTPMSATLRLDVIHFIPDLMVDLGLP